MIKITHYQIRNGTTYPTTPFECEIPCDKVFYWDDKGRKPEHITFVENELKNLAEKIAKENSSEKGIKKPEDIFFVYIDTLFL
jgi:hypothetical protein